MPCCPYPSRCEYNDYKKTGVHFCALAKCLYQTQALHLISGQTEQLSSPTVAQENNLAQLKGEINSLLESG